MPRLIAIKRNGYPYRDKIYPKPHCDLQSGYSEPVYPFRCPECDASFTKLSGLFQHVYSNTCNQNLYEGKMAKLTKWLENRHNKDEEE
jgi:hypothetical protein